ncbi:hypothetical protein L249_2342 [Ophiocordyceps polyrhachis-furcata BCC 54312]|uniref:Uncharacterized protein n=1 Tax=Ophiocordyceps polyrhachis-furcata BCC 54312 TaxID=1330021 RepID=A0A367LRR6_9HYPO|nr:hypothetical protein L249_2342 [Ophiocordyceps polyrhachis-furcata BCC 54312]
MRPCSLILASLVGLSAGLGLQPLRIPLTLADLLFTSVQRPSVVRNGSNYRGPIYAIAHRVLTKDGVDKALSHGANATEIDAGAFNEGWWADDDRTGLSHGDSMWDLLKFIGQKAGDGRKVAFVWLDIKDPDKFGKGHNASIEGLRDTGTRPSPTVLYGFYTDGRARAYNVIRHGLNWNEAIALDGDAKRARQIFESEGPTDIRQRVFTRGYFNWKAMTQSDYNAMLDNLKEARESNAFGRVFGWTLVNSPSIVIKIADPVHDTVLYAGVDGLIYGRAALAYDAKSGWGIDQLRSRAEIRLATGDDAPFANLTEGGLQGLQRERQHRHFAQWRARCRVKWYCAAGCRAGCDSGRKDRDLLLCPRGYNQPCDECRSTCDELLKDWYIDGVDALKDVNSATADLNHKGGGSSVWLVPSYTRDRNKACTSIDLVVQKEADAELKDISQGDFRYLKCSRDSRNGHKIQQLALFRKSDGPFTLEDVKGKYFDGFSADNINVGRSGHHLSLIWLTDLSR